IAGRARRGTGNRLALALPADRLEFLRGRDGAGQQKQGDSPAGEIHGRSRICARYGARPKSATSGISAITGKRVKEISGGICGKDIAFCPVARFAASFSERDLLAALAKARGETGSGT